MSDIFRKLIEKDATAYKDQIFNLSAFSITVLTDPSSKVIGLFIENPQLKFRFNNLKPETADLFQKSFKSSQDVGVIPASLGPSEQREILRTLSQFSKMYIKLPDGKEMMFGAYLMMRIFGNAESCELDNKTCAFTLTFAKERKIPLTNLPQDKPAETLGILKQALKSTFCIPKKIKGKLDRDEMKLSFESGFLTLVLCQQSFTKLGCVKARGLR